MLIDGGRETKGWRESRKVTTSHPLNERVRQIYVPSLRKCMATSSIIPSFPRSTAILNCLKPESWTGSVPGKGVPSPHRPKRYGSAFHNAHDGLGHVTKDMKC